MEEVILQTKSPDSDLPQEDWSQHGVTAIKVIVIQFHFSKTLRTHAQKICLQLIRKCSLVFVAKYVVKRIIQKIKWYIKSRL